MGYRTIGIVLVLATAAGLGFSGCVPQGNPEPDTTGEAQTAQEPIPEEMSGIAKLPQAEQAAALEQRICPVTQEPLGSMGKPI